MRKVFVFLMIVFACLFIMFCTVYGLRQYRYKVNVGQYIKLADDASTPQMKLDYLNEYTSAVAKNVTRNEARYIFKQQRLTKETQLEILSSLTKRLEDLAAMAPDSLPYQQGMQQISSQEFDHTLLEIDGVFWDCFIRNSFFIYSSMAWAVACFILAAASVVGIVATSDYF